MHITFQDSKPKPGGLEAPHSSLLTSLLEFPVLHSKRVKMTRFGSFSRDVGLPAILAGLALEPD
jgi:hypothetical protein